MATRTGPPRSARGHHSHCHGGKSRPTLCLWSRGRLALWSPEGPDVPQGLGVGWLPVPVTDFRLIWNIRSGLSCCSLVAIVSEIFVCVRCSPLLGAAHALVGWVVA